ncbi:hypothetical protein VM1G_00447 [Cytospora mali]|uniref:Uncharacterized protein n=1 Tax=Cytospora mali TaxID=578113 RepID=A0A194VMY9_CYTMA|nr:hypothetical protein VM1G_00447 [Valsa mali]
MSLLTPRVSLIMLINRNELDNDGTSCSNDAWGCLNTTGQFGVIFSIITVVTASVWIYWYTVIRPRKERDKRVDQDIEMDLGDGRTVVVSSGPYQRTVVFRGVRSPSPPPPAYRPPTPGRGPAAPSGLESMTATSPSPRPSQRVPRSQVWPPLPGTAPQTPRRTPRHPIQSSRHPGAQSFQPGTPFQRHPAPMYPPQFMVPRPPPPLMMYPQSQPPLFAVVPPPPPPPPPPVVPAQGVIPPPPPPPTQPAPAANNPQPHPQRPDNTRRPRVPSPGHASTIEDEESDRDGSLPPSRRRSPSRSPVRNRDRRRQRNSHRRRSPGLRRSPSRGPDHYRGRQRSRSPSLPPPRDRSPSVSSSSSYSSSSRSYRSSTSLDSEMRSGLESLLERAERRRRAREAERLQTLVDRYDSEEQEAQADRSDLRGHSELGWQRPNGITEGTERTIQMTKRARQSDHGVASRSTSHPSTSSSLELDDDAGYRLRTIDVPHAKTSITVNPAWDIAAAHLALTNGSSNDLWYIHQARLNPESDDMVAPLPQETVLRHEERPPAFLAQITLSSDIATIAKPRPRLLQRPYPKGLVVPTSHRRQLTVDILLLTTACFSTFPTQLVHPPAPAQHVGTGASPLRGIAVTSGGGWANIVMIGSREAVMVLHNLETSRVGGSGTFSHLKKQVEDRARKRVAKSTGIHAHCHPVLFLALDSDERLVTRMIIAHMTPAGEDHGRQGLQIIVPATADARARFPRSAQRACSSPLSTRLSISQKRRSGRRWTECAPEGVAQAAVRRMVRMTTRRIEGGRGEAKRKSEVFLNST